LHAEKETTEEEEACTASNYACYLTSKAHKFCTLNPQTHTHTHADRHTNTETRTNERTIHKVLKNSFLIELLVKHKLVVSSLGESEKGRE